MSEKNSNSRSAERSNVFLSAALCTPSRSFPVRIRNISASGVLLDGANLPGDGAMVSLRRAHLTADGKIVWQANELRGLRFSAEIDVAEWVKLKVHAAQQRVDQVVAAVRREQQRNGLLNTLPEAASDPETLESICTALEQICERLSNSPTLTDEVAEDLVRLDTLVHSLRQLARSEADRG